MSNYHKQSWKVFRDSIIELNGNECSVCGKTSDETVLQVHHKNYIAGRMPWEYGMDDLITICRGCHAMEHGIIMPNHGWEYMDYEDLGALIGECEYCGNLLRYTFCIYHRSWGTIEVGTICCDNLTDSLLASNARETQTKFKGREHRFINSKRWELVNNIHKIKQGLFNIEIDNIGSDFYLKIHDLKSTTPYPDLRAAKTKAFEVIDNGYLIDYLKSNHIKFEHKKKINK